MKGIKNNLIILIFVLTAIGLILLVLNFQKTIKQGQKAQIFETAENAQRSYPIKLSKGTVDFFNLRSGSNKIIFYENIDSIIYEIGFDGGSKRELARIPDVSEIIFSPNGKELIASISEKKGEVRAYFDLQNDKKIELHKNIRSLAFSPNGEKIVYHFYDGASGEGWISLSEPDGSNFTNIFKTRIKEMSFLWLEDGLIIFYLNGESGLVGFSMAPDGKNLTKINEDGLNYYLNPEIREKTILEEMGIKAANLKLSPLKDYLIFTNSNDKKLYSLKNLF